jgi:hypothetical protein
MAPASKRATFKMKCARNVSAAVFALFIFTLIQSCTGFLGPHLMRLPVPGRLLSSSPAILVHALELRTSGSPRRACRENLYQRSVSMMDSRFSSKDRVAGNFRKEDRDRHVSNRDYSHQAMTVVNSRGIFPGPCDLKFEQPWILFFFLHMLTPITVTQIKDLGVYNGASLQIIDKGRGPYIRCDISKSDSSPKRAVPHTLDL